MWGGRVYAQMQFDCSVVTDHSLGGDSNVFWNAVSQGIGRCPLFLALFLVPFSSLFLPLFLSLASPLALANGTPGGGLERTAPGNADIPAKVLKVEAKERKRGRFSWW